MPPKDNNLTQRLKNLLLSFWFVTIFLGFYFVFCNIKMIFNKI